MSFVLTVAGTVVGASIGIILTKVNDGKGKDKVERKENSREKTESKEYGLSSYDSRLLDVLINIAYANELDKFVLVERTRRNGEAKFQYLYDGYLFTVKAEPDFVKCKVEKEKTVLINYEYDRDWHEYDKKVIVSSVLEEGPQQKVLDLLEDFMDEVNHYDWEAFEEDLIVINDSKVGNGLKDAYIIQDRPPLLKPVSDIKEFVYAENLKGPIHEEFLNAIERIEEVGAKLETVSEELDVETRHVYEELIEKDLGKLYAAYVNLSEEKKESYEKQILDGIQRINTTTKNLLEQIDKRNVHEIESVLHVIKERYI